MTVPPDDAPTQVAKLLALPKNWDSYGADPISPFATDAALQVLETLRRVTPHIVPRSNGGVQLEWHSMGGTLDVEITIEPDGSVSYE